MKHVTVFVAFELEVPEHVAAKDVSLDFPKDAIGIFHITGTSFVRLRAAKVCGYETHDGLDVEAES